MSILLADDDAELATFLSRSLESQGYSVHTALDEDAVMAELRRQNYKLIILDLNFGETDGLKLLEKLRAEGLGTPVIVLSARNRVDDRIQSLNLGADDYITKPFSFQELAARTNALLRRKIDPSLNVLRVENLELDPASRKVHRGKRDIKLSPKEFDLLFLLMRHAGETVNRQELLRESWGLELETDSNLVDVYVNYLRKKIDAPGDDKLIHTIRGVGYRIGRPAPLHGRGPAGKVHPDATGTKEPQDAPAITAAEPAAMAPAPPMRALVHSLAHDLAQPLTSVRCFLEMMQLHGSKFTPPEELKNIELQADRAISLAKGISALVREAPAPTAPWSSLETLLNDILDDFLVLIHSGLLTLDRQIDASIQVTSNPVLRQLIVLFLSKLVGRNTAPLLLTMAAQAHDRQCMLEFAWKPNVNMAGAPSANHILGKELAHVQELARSMGGELILREDSPSFTLNVPCVPRSAREEQVPN